MLGGGSLNKQLVVAASTAAAGIAAVIAVTKMANKKRQASEALAAEEDAFTQKTPQKATQQGVSPATSEANADQVSVVKPPTPVAANELPAAELPAAAPATQESAQVPAIQTTRTTHTDPYQTLGDEAIVDNDERSQPPSPTPSAVSESDDAEAPRSPPSNDVAAPAPPAKVEEDYSSDAEGDAVQAVYDDAEVSANETAPPPEAFEYQPSAPIVANAEAVAATTPVRAAVIPATEDPDDITVVHVDAAHRTEEVSSPSLKDLPALRVPSSMKIFETVDDLDTVRSDFQNWSFSSLDEVAEATASSSKRRTKLLEINRLIQRMSECMERERMRLVEVVLQHGIEASPEFELQSGMSAESWLQAVRALEASVNTVSLRRLLGQQKGTRIATYFAAEVAGDSEFLTHLHPFTCLLVAKELLLKDDTETSITRRLLFYALSKAHTEIAETGITIPSHCQQRIARVALVSFPVDLQVPLYSSVLWCMAGELIESQCGDVDALTEEPLLLPKCLTEAQRLFGLDTSLPESQFQTAYLMSLAVSAGNHGSAWSALALTLDPTESVPLLERSVSAVQCLGEAIRCASGYEHCAHFQLWREAADVLECFESKLRRDSQIRNSPNAASPSTTLQFTVTKAAHEAFLSPESSGTVVCGRKECLSRAAALPQASSDAKIWIALADLLPMGTYVEELPPASRNAPPKRRLSLAEDTTTVGHAMRVSRMDCLKLALAIDPSNSEAWYRAAMAMEDRVVVESRRGAGEFHEIDPRVIESHLLGPTQPNVDRVTALTYAVSTGPDVVKHWFGLAATLHERQNVSQSEATIYLPKSTFGQGSDGSSKPQLVEVSADDLFQHCIKLKPTMQAAIAQWKAKH